MQERLNFPQLIEFLMDVYTGVLDGEGKRKVHILISRLIMKYDIRNVRLDRVIEVLMSTVATHKQSLLFNGHSSVMLAIRSLIIVNQRRMHSLPRELKESHEESSLSVGLKATTSNYLQKFQSFGWILRFIESRDTRLRVLAWDLTTELFDYDFLKANPSIVQTALNTYLKHQELFSVKISALKFLLKACDCLIHNCDIFAELETSSDLSHIEHSQTYIGSHTEQMSIKILLQLVAK